MSTVARTLSFVGAYIKTNLQMAMEYRASFIAQVFTMFLNNGMWLAFWYIYFTRFPILGDWRREDIVVLWSMLSLAYGLVNTVFGNVLQLSSIIVRGGLDFYLAHPRNVLLHLLISRMSFAAVGDIAFGLVVFLAWTEVTLARLGLFFLSSIIAGLFLLAFTILAHSLAFFIGNAESLASELFSAFIHFSTYPTTIFGGLTRLLLFTLIPAGFVSSLPVRVIRQLDPIFLLYATGAGAVLMVIAYAVFSWGLSRYESGNLIVIRM